MSYTYEYFQKSADFLKSKVDFTPEIAIILGSCLGPFAQEIEHPIVVDYKDIPNFLVSTVASHAGKLIFGHHLRAQGGLHVRPLPLLRGL